MSIHENLMAMVKRLQTIATTICLLTGMSAFAASAQAGSLSFKSPTISGDAPTDYLLYDAEGTNTFLVSNSAANLEKVLSGNSNSPTGNVELASSSEKSGFDFTKATALQGTIGGRSLTISSLTEKDWNATYQNGLTFGQYWFSQALDANGYGDLTKSDLGAGLFDIFKNYGGFQRFSDPNIAYVNQDDQTGKVQIGLAGHFDATSLITSSIDQFLVSASSDLTKLQTGLDSMRSARSTLQTQFNQVPQTIVVNRRTVPNPNYTAQRNAIQEQINKLNVTIADAEAQAKQAKVIIASVSGVKTTFAQKTIQASEVFKYTYDGGESKYGYSFTATRSGLTEKGDGVSHSGNYEVVFQGVAPPPPPPRKVPEPTLILGLVGVGGLMLRRRANLNKA